MPHQILLSDAEIESGLNRVQRAEALILQLPADHDGRNTWLLNFGVDIEARRRRGMRGICWDHMRRCAKSYEEPEQ